MFSSVRVSSGPDSSRPGGREIVVMAPTLEFSDAQIMSSSDDLSARELTQTFSADYRCSFVISLRNANFTPALTLCSESIIIRSASFAVAELASTVSHQPKSQPVQLCLISLTGSVWPGGD